MTTAATRSFNKTALKDGTYKGVWHGWSCIVETEAAPRIVEVVHGSKDAYQVTVVVTDGEAEITVDMLTSDECG